MSDTTGNLSPPTSPPPPLSLSYDANIPPHIEIAIFKRFWIWLASLSAFIVALVGLVGALGFAELKEYAKEAASNKAYEEWHKVDIQITDEMQRVRVDLEKATQAASAAVQESSRRAGEASAVSESAHHIATQVEAELSRLEGSVKSAGQIFAAESVLQETVAREVESPKFQALFGSRIDELKDRLRDMTSVFDVKIKRLEDELDEQANSAIGQCRVAIEAEWDKNCAPAQVGMSMPVQSSDWTPVKGGDSNWTGWQIASLWNGGPYNCIRAKLICRNLKSSTK